MIMYGSSEDALSWNHGRHNFKFGGQFWRQIIKTFYAGNNGQLGFLDFDGRFTSPAPGAFWGDGGADFFLGLDYQYGRGVSTGKTWEQSSNIIGIYAQDTWRVTDRLTLNLGLRYDAHTPWVETNDQQANYNIATGNIDLAGKNGASRALYKGFYGGRDFQPRVGFAWTPAALGDHTVIRGAFTISSYLEGTGTNLRLTLNPPFTPAEINAIYNERFTSSDEYNRWNCGQRLGSVLRCAGLRLLRSGVPSRLGSQCAACDRGSMERDGPTSICGQHHRPNWVCRAEGHSLDGAIRLRAESAASSAALRHRARYFRGQSDLYNVLGNPAKAAREPRFRARSQTAT